MDLPDYEKLGAFYLGRTVDTDTGATTKHPYLYDSRDLTTHAVCVGMTGSGKTGLCLALLEEAAIDGVPAIVIDPKGDLANLVLTFPELRPADFAPWIDPGEAARKGVSVDALAASTAELWKKGLAEWDQDGERISRLRDAAEVAVFTPGSNAGRPLSMLREFSPAADLSDSTAVTERIGAVVGGLLALVGIQADPLKSKEHILLANLFAHAWQNGQSLDLASLIQGIQKPPFDKIGVFDLETYYPSKERLDLAMLLNNLLAAPGLQMWLQGERLDAQRLLYNEQGKPRIAIISIAHLNDAERMFAVTMLLNEVVTWMRKQSGTSSLRALIYMDEIFGYFPPTAMPPSKLPLLTLMKQARAFGVGVVLATQNPVDLDYKGLSNAGTWFVGRLQTDRDKARVIDGLIGAAADGSPGGAGATQKASLEKLLANLGNRVFLVRNVHEDATELLQTRWAMCYLRGPMTLAEIQRISATPSSLGMQASESAAAIADSSVRQTTKPMIPSGVTEYYLSGSGSTFSPYVLGSVRLHFVDSGANVDLWQSRTLLTAMNDSGTAPEWSAARIDDRLQERFVPAPTVAASYLAAPTALLRAQSYAAWAKELGDYAYQAMSCDVLRCAALKLSSQVGESEADFRARIALNLRERRDAESDKLRARYAPRINTLGDQVRRAQERVEREKSQLSQQKMSAAISIGSALLGAFLGRKAFSATNVNRIGTAARSAGRIGNESADVAHASESVEVLQQRLADMQAELASDIARVQGEFDPAAVAIETINIKPRKSDTTATSIAIVWVPVT